MSALCCENRSGAVWIEVGCLNKALLGRAQTSRGAILLGEPQQRWEHWGPGSRRTHPRRVLNLLESGFCIMCDDIQTPQVFQLIGTTSAFSRLEHLFSGVNHDYFSHYTESNVSTTPSHAVGEHLPRSSWIQTYRNGIFYSPLDAVLFREEDITPI